MEDFSDASNFPFLNDTSLYNNSIYNSKSCTRRNLNSSAGSNTCIPEEMSLLRVIKMTGGYFFNVPQGFTLCENNEIALADTNNHRCIVVDFNGRLLRQVGVSSKTESQLNFPRKVSYF